MARIGRFSTVRGYGYPLSYVHPPDNLQPAEFSPELLDPTLQLTLEQMRELQDRIEDLTRVLVGESRFY